ncbi:MAG TPA: hypothetical protein VLU47_04195 [Blastocatellia bacterium]|nr:hypothetical protein [Blastocatellia bacterium]
MKKPSLSLLAIAAIVVLASACTDQRAANSVSPGGTSIPVVITLGFKPGTDTYCFSVAPATVTLSRRNGDTILWIVSDPTDLGLTDVQITKFRGEKTGKTDPFGNGGTFTFPSVSPHSAPSKPSGQPVAGSEDAYEYEVVGTIVVNGRPVTVKLDPRVVISG